MLFLYFRPDPHRLNLPIPHHPVQKRRNDEQKRVKRRFSSFNSDNRSQSRRSNIEDDEKADLNLSKQRDFFLFFKY